MSGAKKLSVPLLHATNPGKARTAFKSCSFEDLFEQDNENDVKKHNKNYGMLLKAVTTLKDATDAYGDTPLHFTSIIVENDNELLTRLLEEGADVNAQNKEGETPLHTGINKKNVPFIKTLIKAGADVNIRDNNGKSPLRLLSSFKPKKTAETILALIDKVASDSNKSAKVTKTSASAEVGVVKSPNKKVGKKNEDTGAAFKASAAGKTGTKITKKAPSSTSPSAAEKSAGHKRKVVEVEEDEEKDKEVDVRVAATATAGGSGPPSGAEGATAVKSERRPSATPTPTSGLKTRSPGSAKSVPEQRAAAAQWAAAQGYIKEERTIVKNEKADHTATTTKKVRGKAAATASAAAAASASAAVVGISSPAPAVVVRTGTKVDPVSAAKEEAKLKIENALTARLGPSSPAAAAPEGTNKKKKKFVKKEKDIKAETTSPTTVEEEVEEEVVVAVKSDPLSAAKDEAKRKIETAKQTQLERLGSPPEGGRKRAKKGK